MCLWGSGKMQAFVFVFALILCKLSSWHHLSLPLPHPATFSWLAAVGGCDMSQRHSNKWCYWIAGGFNVEVQRKKWLKKTFQFLLSHFDKELRLLQVQAYIVCWEFVPLLISTCLFGVWTELINVQFILFPPRLLFVPHWHNHSLSYCVTLKNKW